MRRFISTLLVVLLFLSLFCNYYVFAEESGDGGISAIKGAMVDVGKPGTFETTQSKTSKVINNIIGIIQVAGSGISLIVITMLGIKYILASPSEKADVKKNIMPILIGCILLFAAVNIVGMIESFSNATLPAGGAGA